MLPYRNIKPMPESEKPKTHSQDKIISRGTTLVDLQRQHEAIKAAAQVPALPNARPAPISSTEHFGAMIRDKRKAMGLTQQQFADLTGVGRRFVSELEAGKPTLEFGRVLKVCQSVGLDLIVAAR